MAKEPPKSLMRSLGEFFGHIVQGATTDPAAPASSAAPESQVVRQVTHEETRQTPQGPVTVRRTTIEEVVIHPPVPPAPPHPPSSRDP